MMKTGVRRMMGQPSGLEPKTDRVLDQIAPIATDPAALRDAVRASAACSQDVSQHDIELRDGRILERYVGPVYLGGSDHLGRVVCYRDVTQQRRLEARRSLVAEREAAVGRLAANFAHEIDNPLTYLLGNIQVVLARLEESSSAPSDLLDALRDAQAGAEQIRTLVGNLRALSRGDDEVRQPEDVSPAVTSAFAHVRESDTSSRDPARAASEAPSGRR